MLVKLIYKTNFTCTKMYVHMCMYFHACKVGCIN